MDKFLDTIRNSVRKNRILKSKINLVVKEIDDEYRISHSPIK